MATQTVTVKEARNRFAELIERASIAGDTFVITKFGKTKAVIAPPSATTMGTTPDAAPSPRRAANSGDKRIARLTASFIERYRSDLEALARA